MSLSIQSNLTALQSMCHEAAERYANLSSQAKNYEGEASYSSAIFAWRSHDAYLIRKLGELLNSNSGHVCFKGLQKEKILQIKGACKRTEASVQIIWFTDSKKNDLSAGHIILKKQDNSDAKSS